MTNPSKFWPLDYEPEDQIYDNPSWDLPGLRRTKKSPVGQKNASRRKRKHAINSAPKFR